VLASLIAIRRGAAALDPAEASVAELQLDSYRGPAHALRVRDTAVDALKGVDMVVAPVRWWAGRPPLRQEYAAQMPGGGDRAHGGRMTLGSAIIYDDGWRIRDLRALRRDQIGFVFQAPY